MNYEKQIEELTHKMRELTESLKDKSKRMDEAEKASVAAKADLSKAQTLNKKLSTDLDTLKQTNALIQKELTKSSQRCVVLEKEKALMQEKFRLDMEALKTEAAAVAAPVLYAQATTENPAITRSEDIQVINFISLYFNKPCFFYLSIYLL